MDIDNVPVLRLCQLFLLYECISLTVEKGGLLIVFISWIFAKHNLTKNKNRKRKQINWE